MWVILIRLVVDGYLSWVWGDECPECGRKHSLQQHPENIRWFGTYEWCRGCDYEKKHYRYIEKMYYELQHHPFCFNKSDRNFEDCKNCKTAEEKYPENFHRSKMVREYFSHALNEMGI